MPTTPLTIAIPSKGRIEEGATAFFASAGLSMSKEAGARDYRGRLSGIPDAELLFLAANEIPSALESGAAHIGITGEDLLRDRIAGFEKSILPVTALGFSRADVVVAVPRAWIDVSSMADLDEAAHDFRVRHRRHMRVATKYFRLTREFFAQHGLADYRIVESAGATEGAPASGLAEIIVDITTTGATLVANNLKVLSDGVILKSEAKLAASLTARWGGRARAALAYFLNALWAADRARFAVLTFRSPADSLALAGNLHAAFGEEVTFEPETGREQSVLCPTRKLHAVAAFLRSTGVSESIRASRVEVGGGTNLWLDHLLPRLPPLS
jgi:ATP phosphoribosyltransferase